MLKRTRRPSPALAISLIALFVALGGTGYAAVTINGKNLKNKSVAGKKLKNKTVTGGKIKNKTITGGKLADNTLSGTQINEASLGTVPSADKANSATNATNAANAVNATNAANAANAGNVAGRQRAGLKRVAATAGINADSARAAAPEINLFTAGPFTVYGKCITDSSGPNTFADVYVRTTQGGSVLSSVFVSLSGNPFLEPGTAEPLRRVLSTGTAANTAASLVAFFTDFSAFAPDGTAFSANVPVSVKNGSLPGGNGVYGDGDACLFSGQLNQLN